MQCGSVVLLVIAVRDNCSSFETHRDVANCNDDSARAIVYGRLSKMAFAF